MLVRCPVSPLVEYYYIAGVFENQGRPRSEYVIEINPPTHGAEYFMEECLTDSYRYDTIGAVMAVAKGRPCFVSQIPV